RRVWIEHTVTKRGPWTIAMAAISRTKLRLTHQAYEDVRSAARGISNDAAHWPPRIGLRPCYPRHRWQRDSASGQMQEFAAGKFHFDPSLSGLSIRSPRRPGRVASAEFPGQAPSLCLR